MENEPREKKTLADLIHVMAELRTPVTGCPWDLEQTFETIAPYTIEEAYEVADAIARGDLADLREELGDLLLQVVYHSRIAEEAGAFDFADVADGITRKMVRRHPHVFGTAEQRAAGASRGFWERIKDAEKREKADQRRAMGLMDDADVTPPAGALDGVPVNLPALTRAVKLQKKAARVGFDWPDLAPVFDKMREELAELEETMTNTGAGDGGADRSRQVEEFGDLMFVMANVARHMKIDPEAALAAANQKFTRRFGAIEAALHAQGRRPEDSNLAEMDALWDAAKQREKREERS